VVDLTPTSASQAGRGLGSLFGPGFESTSKVERTSTTTTTTITTTTTPSGEAKDSLARGFLNTTVIEKNFFVKMVEIIKEDYIYFFALFLLISLITISILYVKEKIRTRNHQKVCKGVKKAVVCFGLREVAHFDENELLDENKQSRSILRNAQSQSLPADLNSSN